ncbi:MAG TPA: DUF4926 domain-containing protein [Thermoplasmata archaeon]|nr:DUF4926 domain-containing protein [Thermoplasmata archaeon]
MKLFDVVRLLHDQPGLDLKAGMEGAVVEVDSVPTEGYEVEFVDETGRTMGLASFPREELELVWAYRENHG